MPPRYPTYRPPMNPGYRPAPQPQRQPYYPPQPAPAPQVQMVPMVPAQPAAPAAPEQPRVVIMRPAKPANVLEYITKHPVAPVAGAILWLISQFTEEPTPPTVPAGLPDALKAQWPMIFAQNQQKFQRRMQLFEKAGEVLLGYASVNSVLDAIQKAKRTA